MKNCSPENDKIQAKMLFFIRLWSLSFLCLLDDPFYAYLLVYTYCHSHAELMIVLGRIPILFLLLKCI